MKRHLFTIVLFLITFSPFLSAQNKQDKIIIGKIDSLYSNELGETRKVLIYVPSMTANEISIHKRYPVVYIIDGERHFLCTVGIIQQLSQVNGNAVFPEMIVIGIVNTNRNRDLTPTSVPWDTSSGGGEKFTSFIEKELIRYIDTHYPTSPYRILAGHSLGGLMVINTLVYHSNLFNSYVAIDPSLTLEEKLFNEYVSAIQKNKFGKKILYIAMANTFVRGTDIISVRKDTSQTNQHPKHILKFIEVLKNATSNELKWSWKYYPNDNHDSVPLMAQYDALHFIFSEYKMPSYSLLLENADKADSIIIKHYKELSQGLGIKILPPEIEVNYLGYLFMDKRYYKVSYSLFDMNIKNYPNSLNVFDSMGDYYVKVGEKQKAIECYTKAYSINNWPYTRDKLEKLKQDR